MEEDQHLSNIDEGDEQINDAKAEHKVKEDNPMTKAWNKPDGEEISKQTFGTVTHPTNTSTIGSWSISPAELAYLKATNFAGFLKPMMNASSSSSEKGGTSSTTSGNKPSGRVSNNLLCQIKYNVFGIYLIQVVNDNVNICFGLRD